MKSKISDLMEKKDISFKKRDGLQPRDLSRNSVEWSEAKENASRASQIFTNETFESMGLHPYLCSLLKSPLDKGGFDIHSATKVQMLTLPLLMSQTNAHNKSSIHTGVLVKSQTGSGKTLTYLLPVMQELMSLEPPVQRSDGTLALIVAPTRELCNQIYDVLEKLTKVYVRIVPGSISGGEKKKSEKNRLRKGVTVLVATPGRLLDHLKTTESFLLSKLRFFIVDEVDRLFDMGFEKTMQEIFAILQGTSSSSSGAADKSLTLVQRWQTTTKRVAQPLFLRYVMVSATVSKAVQQHALDWMKRFVLVDADHRGGSGPSAAVSKTIASASDLDKALAGRFPSNHTSLSVTQPTSADINNNSSTNMKKSSSKVHSEDGVLVFDDDEEGTAAPVPPLLSHTTPVKEEMDNGLEALQPVPSTLRQFSLSVGMKWRLAALLALLRLHRGQKIVVFFSTCDSVDYHALLLKHLAWPRDLGVDPTTLQPTSQLLNTYLSNRTKTKANYKAQASCKSVNPGLADNTGREHLDPLEWRFTSSLLSDSTSPAATSSSSSTNPGYVYRLHGKVPQHIRRLVARDFAKAKSGVLLCTDVAARGLDLPAVQWIVQYDPPADTADYVHRIGRTARRGNSGSAVLFLLPSEQLYIHLLSEHGLQLTPLSSQSMLQTAAKQIPFLNQKDKNFKNVDELCAVSLQRNAEGFVGKRALLTLCGIQAYRSFLRAYGTRSADCKGIFKIQDLHLGHCAKAFALHDKPSDFALHSTDNKNNNNNNKNNANDKNNVNNMLTTMLSEDIVGKVFNGDFASPVFKEKLKQAQLPAKSVNASNSEDSDSDENEEKEDENSEKEDSYDEEKLSEVNINNKNSKKCTVTGINKFEGESLTEKLAGKFSAKNSKKRSLDEMNSNDNKDGKDNDKMDEDEAEEEKELEMKMKKQKKSSGMSNEISAAENRLVKRRLSFGNRNKKASQLKPKKNLSLRAMAQKTKTTSNGVRKGRNQLRAMSEFSA